MQSTHHPEAESFRVPQMEVSDRATFLIRTYNHLFGAILAFTGFEIPDEFVVGYGIDYAQRNRNLPYIGKVRFV